MDTISTAGVSNISAELMQRLGAMSQSTGTTTPIFPDLFLADTLHSRLSQINLQSFTNL